MSKFSKAKERELKSNKDNHTYFPCKDDRMTQQEVAEMFGRTVQTIINWKNRSIIPYYQIGRHPIFSRKQLIEFASQNQSLIKQ